MLQAIERKYMAEKRYPTPAENVKIGALIDKQRAIYDAAWEEATRSRNLVSETRDASPQRVTGNLRGGSESQARTTQPLDLVKGMSSQSANSVPAGKASGSFGAAIGATSEHCIAGKRIDLPEKDEPAYGNLRPLSASEQPLGVPSPRGAAARRGSVAGVQGQLDLFVANCGEGLHPAVVPDKPKLLQTSTLIQTGLFRTGIDRVRSRGDAAHIHSGCPAIYVGLQ